MRFILLLAFILFTSCQTKHDKVKEYLETRDKTKFSYTESLEIEKDLLLFRYDDQVDWWGSFDVIKLQNGFTEFKMDHRPGEHSIFKQGYFSSEKEMIIHVTARTHAGNGNTYFYRVLKEKLKLIGSIYTMGWHEKGLINCHISYKHLNNDNKIDIVVSSKILDEDDGKLFRIGSIYTELYQNDEGNLYTHKKEKIYTQQPLDDN